VQRDLPATFNVAAHFIDRNVREGRESKIAIECEDVQVSYGELLRRVNAFGNALRSLGVRSEERVQLLLLDSPEFLYSFFGAIKIGAVAVPTSTLLRPGDYEYLLNDTRARVALVSEALVPQMQAIPRNRLRYLQIVIVVGAAAGGNLAFADLLEHSSPELDSEPACRDDPAFWLYSSGSTGVPKGCVHLHHDMVVCAEQYAKAVLGISEHDRCFSVAKLFFAYGLGNAGYFPLAVGATSILRSGPPTPAGVFAAIERHRPTLFFSVPSNYAALLAHHRAGGDFDLSSIRHAVSAGEALPASIYDRFKQRFGIEILDAIGSTEALHMFIANRPGAVRPGSSGQVLPGCEARILDDEGCPVPVGGLGNLLIRSDAVCSHYWNQHEKTKDTIQGHWLRTGDKYRQDAGGYFWYAGRSDDMLKVSGMWVSPVEIECTLIEHPAVLEAAVVGRKDQDELVKPAAFVVLCQNVMATDAMAVELQEFVASHLAGYKRPRWVEFLPELPKTPTGKIQRYKLRERLPEVRKSQDAS
jgi:benzoate-CoA ligase